jgi:hypothetical protein
VECGANSSGVPFCGYINIELRDKKEEKVANGGLFQSMAETVPKI